MKQFSPILLMILYTCFHPVYAQESVYADQAWTLKIDSTLSLIYNHKFDEAVHGIDLVESHYGEHPAVYLLRAELVFWKDRPLIRNTQSYDKYENLLLKVIDIAENKFPGENLEMERNFYLMSGYSLLTEQYAEDKDYWKVLSVAKPAYRYLIKGMGREPELPDYYFSSGLYNYYRVKYPELHPFYRPFLWLFADGDKDLGISQLKQGASRSLFLKIMSNIYLFHIYLRYENNPDLALPFSEFLVEKYPDNPRFKAFYAENLIWSGHFQKAYPLARELMAQNHKLYKMTGYLFNGLIAVNDHHLAEAKFSLSKSLELSDGILGEDEHFVSMIHLGLARLSIQENEIKEARDQYHIALAIEPYLPVKAEAEKFLQSKK